MASILGSGTKIVTNAIAHFGSEPAQVGAARRFVSATLQAWGCPAFVDLAALLTSELVANAIIHAGTDCHVVVRRLPDRIRIEVGDQDPRLPVRKHYSVSATTGRGLALVEDLSLAWGSDRTGAGKQVWFELDEASAAQLAPSPANAS